jgi:hypothetical protein
MNKWRTNGNAWLTKHLELLGKHRGRETAEKIMADLRKMKEGMN